MKRKMSIILNIVTLCLCVCAIAIGVYSAKNASLTIDGSIGFVANNCNATVTAIIYGDSINEETTDPAPEGIVRRIFDPIGSVNIQGKDMTLDIGDIYFCDMDTINGKPAPIKLYFTIENTSNFNIKASVTLPSITGVTVLANKDSIQIDKDGTGEIQVTFTVDNPDAGVEKISFSNFKLTLEKYDFTKSDIVVKAVDKTNGDSIDKKVPFSYYIEYGTNIADTSVTLPWYIIGKTDTDGQLTSLAEGDIVANSDGTYSMKNTINYALLSKYVLPTSKQSNAISFNNNQFVVSSEDFWEETGSLEMQTGDCWSTDYVDVMACDYSISNVRSFLNGRTVCQSATSWTHDADPGYFTNSKGVLFGQYLTPVGDEVNYYSANTLKNTQGTNDIYSLIKPRTLGNLYTKMSDDNTPVDIQLPTSKTEGILDIDSDAFWLLSYAEFNNMSSNRDASRVTSILGGNPCDWFIRSSHSKYCQIHFIYNSDYEIAIGNSSSYGETGIRPAFMI